MTGPRERMVASKQRVNRPHLERTEVQWLQATFEVLAVADGYHHHGCWIEIASRQRFQGRRLDRIELGRQFAVVVEREAIREQVAERTRGRFVGLERSGQRLGKRAPGALQLVRS